MITLTPARLPTDPQAVKTPGGFAWWYLDLVDLQGNGLVIIWSVGLPFVPGYAAAARAGTPQSPGARPVTTVSAYEKGRRVYYDFQVHSPENVDFQPVVDGHGRWKFDDNIFTTEVNDDCTHTLRIQLDRAIPGTTDRLTGDVEIRGALRQGGSVEPSEPSKSTLDHAWSPRLLACNGVARLSTPSMHLAVHGRAYHDRNSSTLPLHELGIAKWWWGRLSLPDHDIVWYRLQPTGSDSTIREMVLLVDREGVVQEVDGPIELHGRMRGNFGLSSPRSLRFHDPLSREVTIQLEHLVDDGPFYQRHIVTGTCGEHTGTGFAELVVPDKIDLDAHRPFVRMAVHNLNGPNSLFLPLFNGPTQSRLSRLPLWWRGHG